MKRRRVKITGIGPITPTGLGVEPFWTNLVKANSFIRPFSKLDPELGPFVAAFIDRFEIANFIEGKVIPKGAARHTLFALAAARLAIDDASINPPELRRKRCAVVVGSSLMDFEGIGKTIDGVSERGVRGALARTVYTTNAAVISAAIGSALELESRSISVQTSCCAGLDAIGIASRMVSTGEVDIAICGGTEAPLFRCPLVELRAAGLTPASHEMSDRICRPFDLWRTTGVVGEGAAMVVLEPDTSSREPYCYLAGYSSCNDAEEVLCSGMVSAIRNAIADAGVSVLDVDLINAWGPGHVEVDSAEAQMLNRVFGERLQTLPAFSIKGSLGNPLGAAPAIQVAASALALMHGVIPATVNWNFPDPACNLNLSSKSRFLDHGAALINAHGLSGVNSSVVLTKC
jgi:3-oxoacyl-(acyl-carrier-protein) synthase